MVYISFFRLMPLLGAVALLGACTTDRSFGASADVEVTDLAALPTPGAEGLYKIGPQQALNIEVVGAEELSGPFLTDERGNLTFPFLGKVDVSGEFPSVAATMIADGLRGQYLLDPQVRIVIAELPPPSISIGGEVDEPGSYEATPNLTLLRAVNLAQGLGENARLDDVLIMRTVDGQKYIGAYNLQAIQRGNYPDPAVYPNDIVLVGDSPARRRLATILQFVPVLSSAIILLDRVGR